MNQGVSVYMLELGDRDQDRLAVLNRYLNPGSERFLRRAGLRPGMRVLDVGCGQGQITHFIAREIGSHGHVIGVDHSEEQLAIARAGAPYPDRAEWLCASAERLELAGNSFDLVYCRLLLMHVQEPLAVLRALCAALAPGGCLVVETGLVDELRYVPERPDADLWKGWWFALGDAIGASYRFPPRAPAAVRALGMQIEHMDSHQPVSFDRDAKLLHVVGFEQVAPAYLAKAGASEREIEQQRQLFQECVDDPETYVELYRILQICARKPK